MHESARPLMPDASGEPIGIAAGGGRLPRIVADAAAANGWTPHVLAIADGLETEWHPYFSRPMPWGQLGNGLAWLKANGVRRLVLCGTISTRPDFRSILPTMRTSALLPQIFSVISGGDDNLLRAAARMFERWGLETVAVQAIAPRLLVPAGVLTGAAVSADEAAAVALGFSAARTLGALDVGQAVVASKDRVIALEGIEGTREMLLRVADLRQRGRIGRSERCVLVKCVKPDQDIRFDLPSIGVSTIEEAAAAGLSGIALSAGRALVVGLEDTVAAARREGLFVLGQPDIDP